MESVMRRARRAVSCDRVARWCAVLMYTAAPCLAAAQPAPPPSGCDARLLTRATQGSTAYRVRGKAAVAWCEGTYVADVGNVELLLEGFMRPLSVDSTRVRRVDTLWVEWTASPGSEVQIMARSRARGYYQLDVRVRTDSTGRGRWAWPTDVLRQQQVYPFGIPIVRPSPQVWVQAVTLRPGAGTVDSIHLPLRIRTMGDTAPPPRDVELRLFVRTAVENLRTTLHRLDDNGARTPVTMLPDCRAPYGGTGGTTPVVVRVCLPPDAPGGLYELTVGADADGAMVRTKTVRFWLRGAAR